MDIVRLDVAGGVCERVLPRVRARARGLRAAGPGGGGAGARRFAAAAPAAGPAFLLYHQTLRRRALRRST